VSVLTAITHRLRNVDTDTAADDAEQQVASSELKDRLALPSRHPLPTILERWATAYHEAAHATAASAGGSEILELRVRDDATGLCRVSEIKKPTDRIVFALAGVIAEAKFNPSSIHRYTAASYDFLTARLLIDSLNVSAGWPYLTCERAATIAVQFVESHWREIGNVATALNDAGELDNHWIRIFASCGT
jgi:hypothetical protein